MSTLSVLPKARQKECLFRKKNFKAAFESMACIKYADVEIVLACIRTHMTTFLNSLFQEKHAHNSV